MKAEFAQSYITQALISGRWRERLWRSVERFKGSRIRGSRIRFEAAVRGA
jgi:hypothetical protein